MLIWPQKRCGRIIWVKFMSATSLSTVSSIYRYPVKGLSGEALDETLLEPGKTLACDRIYAVENGAGRFDEAHPKYLAKINFLMLMRNERLALLETRFDAERHQLTIWRGGKQVASGDLSTSIGRKMIEQFLAGFVRAEKLRGAPHIVHAPGHSFSDVSAKCLHIVNLASLRELERVAETTIDPLRFRANVYVDGLEPWHEFNWLNSDIQIGLSRLKVFKRTMRCAATNVDPQTGVRDMGIPALLQRHWGHSDFGVYAEVVDGGSIKTGDQVLHGLL